MGQRTIPIQSPFRGVTLSALPCLENRETWSTQYTARRIYKRYDCDRRESLPMV